MELKNKYSIPPKIGKKVKIKTEKYRLELLNVIQSDIKRICAQIDKRHANYANHLNR